MYAWFLCEGFIYVVSEWMNTPLLAFALGLSNYTVYVQHVVYRVVIEVPELRKW